MTQPKRRIFIDMDGVLADFQGGYRRAFGVEPPEKPDAAYWERMQTVPRFFLNLGALPGAVSLVDAADAYGPPTILTVAPNSLPHAAADKAYWIFQLFGPIACITAQRGKDKALHGSPGDILIDDREECGLPWEAMGGVWIKHTSAEDTIKQLQPYFKA